MQIMFHDYGGSTEIAQSDWKYCSFIVFKDHYFGGLLFTSNLHNWPQNRGYINLINQS